MELFTALKKLSSSSWITDYTVIRFSGTQEYPLLFFSLLIKHLKKQHGRHIETVADDTAYPDLMHRFETSFLGMSNIYWVGDVQRFDQSIRDRLSVYLDGYQGPNVLFVYDAPQEKRKTTKRVLEVELPTLLTKKSITELCALFGNGRIRTIPNLAQYEKQLTLDRVCLLIQYLSVVGSGLPDFNQQWLGQIIIPELSLFTLSQHFFARDGMRFFKQWATLKEQYAAPFWISFWSEQIWRASAFIELSSQRNFAEAKRMSFKLPFSFIQRDWKQVTALELNRAHHALYTYDCAIKNGGDPDVLELFYTDYLQRAFR